MGSALEATAVARVCVMPGGTGRPCLRANRLAGVGGALDQGSNDILADAGLRRRDPPVGEERVDFVHNTFKEFLAASASFATAEHRLLARLAPREDIATSAATTSGEKDVPFTKALLKALTAREKGRRLLSVIAIRTAYAAPHSRGNAQDLIAKVEASLFPRAPSRRPRPRRARRRTRWPPPAQAGCHRRRYTLCGPGPAPHRHGAGPQAIRDIARTATTPTLIDEISQAIDPMRSPMSPPT